MSAQSASETTRHIPILLEPITDFLAEGIRSLPEHSEPGVILDCTLGGGGHSARLLEKLASIPGARNHRLIGVDRDLDAISRNRARFQKELGDGVMELHHCAFSESMKIIGNRPLYGVLADLGISSDQIDSDTRGFSFRFNAPLDMRMNQSRGIPLSEWLEGVSETDLADVIWRYGEERFSRKIAPGGRIAILSFHSLEDRLVKEEFRKRNLYELPFKKPLQAGDSEIELNSRSRSAKLRLAIRKPSEPETPSSMR